MIYETTEREGGQCNYARILIQGEEWRYIHTAALAYGLPQSPLLWFNDLNETLTGIGFRQISEAKCLFTNGVLIIIFYVDDIAVLNCKADCQAAAEFATRFKA